MHRTISAIGIACAIALPAGTRELRAQNPAPAFPDSTRIVVYLPHYLDLPEVARNGLAFARIRQAAGQHVILFLDHEGVALADRHQPRHIAAGRESGTLDMLDAFIRDGGEVLVCPVCAHEQGLAERDLLLGIHFARCENLARACLSPMVGVST